MGQGRNKRKGRAIKHSANVPVTQPALAPPWRFYDLLDKRGLNPIAEHRSRLSKKARAHLERAIDHLTPLELKDWHKPNPASNIGNHIYVIRFKDESGMQHRIYGHCIPEKGCFVMTHTGYEKGGTYYPSDYEERTAKLRDFVNECFEKRATATDWDADV